MLGRSVARRTQEIGVRMALGATRRAVLGLVFSQSLRLLAAGLAAGVLGAVAALASWLPARRAASVDLITALHVE